MENEATTKTPIPIHRESLFWILSPVFCPTRPSCPACPRSTLVETPLQIALFFAKQSQFQNGQYKHKYSKNKGLCQRTTNNEQPTLSKTNPIKPNSSRRSRIPPLPKPPILPRFRPNFPSAKSFLRLRNTQYAIRNTKYET